jgi:hypothetical protein
MFNRPEKSGQVNSTGYGKTVSIRDTASISADYRLIVWRDGK